MNRYRSGGPSKATATTLCQKCLKRGHYTYECSASQQERPYLSRPSRSQQLSNPKLAPKLSSILPPTDAKPAQKAEAIGKASTNEVSKSSGGHTKGRDVGVESSRRQSVSSYSSGSVSSYSTNKSRSRSRTPPRESETRKRRQDESVDRSRIPPPTRTRRSPSLDRRDSETSKAHPRDQRLAREDTRKKTPRDRSRSPAYRARESDAGYRRRSRSRSPYRGQQANDRAPVSQPRAPPRERSMSPYSQRMALTKAKNG